MMIVLNQRWLQNGVKYFTEKIKQWNRMADNKNSYAILMLVLNKG